MNTCLLFYGQPRFGIDNINSISENLIKPLGIKDVYAHFWCDKNNGKFSNQNLQIFLDKFEPQRMEIERSMSFEEKPWKRQGQSKGNTEDEKYHIEALQSVFYSRYRVSRQIHLKEYDRYILIRSDLSINKPLVLPDFPKRSIMCKAGNKFEIHDWLFICDKEGFDWFTNGYMYLDQIYSLSEDASGEVMAINTMQYFKINMIQRFIDCSI